jgi:DNA-binding LacI/PurR family transcriptional regulator
MVRKTPDKSHKPTMHDVARLAGVAQSTVSRVLNSSDSFVPISDETRQRIMNAVQELEYQPNMIARSLRTQRTQMIAVMIGDISNAFYHPIVRSVQDIAGARDYEVLISNSDHLYENEARFLRSVLRRPVDGIIMAPHRLTNKDLDNFVRRSQIPVVAIGAQVKPLLVDVIGGTSEPATYEAVTWLIKVAGHRRIGFIGVADNMPPGPARLKGYKRAMADASLSVKSEWVQKAEFTIEGGQRAMQAFLQQKTLPDAIFASNSLMAIGAIKAAQAQGYHIPDDISVMGFDDIPESSLIQPQLTVVARDVSSIGRQAVELLFERIDGQISGNGRFFQSEWMLVERESIRMTGNKTLHRDE